MVFKKRQGSSVLNFVFLVQPYTIFNRIYIYCIWQWLDLLKASLIEAKWSRNNMPTLDEYLENGRVTYALGPVLIVAMYLVGPELSEEAARSSELKKLYKLSSNCGRLLNDIQSFTVRPIYNL